MSNRKPHRLGLQLFGVVLFGTFAATASHAEKVPMAVMGKGKFMTKEECVALPQAVWIKAMGRDICMRYYLSTAGGQGSRPVVFLQGDAPSTKDVDTADLVKYADRISKDTKTTGIYLARLGRDGSSGSHGDRHTQLELHATNAALEAIKRHHHFEGFHLYGHSGGANLVAALLGLRRDLACTVPADGKLAGSGKRNVSDPALQVFWASDAIPNIARNHAARIIVVIDPQDRIIPISNQLPFVEKLRRAGGKVEVFFVDSGGDEHADHHATTGHAALVMRECIRGASHDDIAAGLAELVANHHKAALAAEKAKAAKQSDAKSGQRNTP
jgi:dienelactone hydrolase